MKRIRRAINTLILTFSLISGLQAQQDATGNYSLSLFIGEGAGLSASYNFPNNFSAELNVAYHELFYNYGFEEKYAGLSVLDYSCLISSSVLFSYTGGIGEGGVYYRVSAGIQTRVIPKFQTMTNNAYNLGEIVISDPITSTKINFGALTLLGVGYKYNDHWGVFGDIGPYIELHDKLWWSNIQFRVGVTYSFIRRD